MKFLFPMLVITGISCCLGSCKKDSDTPDPVPDPLLTQAVLKFSGNLSDSTGKITAGAPIGTITYVADRNGTPSSAINFDGASGLPYSGLQLKGTAFTVSAWIKKDPANTGMYEIVALGAGSGGFGLFNDPEPGLAISITNTNSAVSPTVVDNNWHNIAGTYDGTDIKLYVDGILKKTTNHPGTMTDGAKSLVLGYFAPTFWKGSIDDLRIYNTVLTDAQIAALAAL